MPLQRICIDTLGDLDSGAARLVIDKLIAMAVADCDDRGEDGKAREVVITLSMTRRGDGLLECGVKGNVRLPVMQTHSTVAKFTATNKGEVTAQFQLWAPDNPDQSELPNIEN